MMMKKLALLLPILSVFVSTGYCQHFAWGRNVLPTDIPGLTAQLKGNISAQRKADVMLSLGFGYLYKPGEEKADLDSAIYYAKQAAVAGSQTSFAQEAMLLTSMIQLERKDAGTAHKMMLTSNDSTRLKLMLVLSRHYTYSDKTAPGNSKHMDSSILYGEASIKLAENIKHAPLLIAALGWHEQIIEHSKSLGLFPIAEKQFLFLVDHCDNVNHPTKAYVMARLGRLYTDNGDFYRALNYGLKAEKALHSNSSDWDVFTVNSHLSSVYKFMKQFEKSLPYYEKILEHPERYKKTSSMYSIASSYCISLRNLNRNDEVIPFMQDFNKRYPATTDLDKSYYHLNLAHTYREKGMFKPAEENFLEAIRLNNFSNKTLAAIYAELGAFYNKFKYPEKGITALKTAETLFTGKNEVVFSSILRLISQSAATLGNYQEAYQYLLRSKAITDSIYDVSKEKHTQELEFQYQTQKKEADLQLKEENIRYLNQHAELMAQDAKLQKAQLVQASLLAGQKETALQLKEKNIEILTTNSKRQKAEIAQAESKRKITILVIVLLAVIIALLIWLFWSKLRSNKIITDKNGLLQQLVTEKSWLVKEMHHRVKNNLHTVMSLLESQSAYLQDDALEAVKNSQCRIFSMSLIHQKLYQDDIVKTIDMECYIPELISYLRECFNLPGSFRIHMDIDPAEFDVSDAVPLGLIVNEVVTNSLKYAHSGEIWISLKATGAHEYELTLADNGIGLQEGFDINTVTTLGFKLIKGLSDQLDAKLNIINKDGLKIKLSGISLYRHVFNKQLTA